MDLTPRDIQQKQFHDAFRGYAHEEVDLFLDEVAAAFDRVFRENQGFHYRLAELEEELQKARGSEDMLKRMLVTAQETADKAVQEAKARAHEMVSSSDAKARQIVIDAEAKAQQILTDASAKADEIVAGAISKENQLQVSIEGMKSFDAEYRARLKAFIQSQLDQLSKGPQLPPEPRPMGAETQAMPRVSLPSSERTDPVPTHVAPAPQDSEPARDEHPLPANGSPASERSPAQPAPAMPMVANEVPGEEPGRPEDRTLAQHPAMVTVPEARVGSKDPDDKDEDDRSIKELFWGDD